MLAGSARTKFIITDGIFSMDGDIAPLKEIVRLAHKYDALTFVDECHSTGPLSVGAAEFHGVLDEIDIITGTLGKALGGASGGYVTGRKEIV